MKNSISVCAKQNFIVKLFFVQSLLIRVKMRDLSVMSEQFAISAPISSSFIVWVNSAFLYLPRANSMNYLCYDCC